MTSFVYRKLKGVERLDLITSLQNHHPGIEIQSSGLLSEMVHLFIVLMKKNKVKKLPENSSLSIHDRSILFNNAFLQLLHCYELEKTVINNAIKKALSIPQLLELIEYNQIIILIDLKL